MNFRNFLLAGSVLGLASCQQTSKPSVLAEMPTPTAASIQQTRALADSTQTTDTLPKNDTITIIGVGDIMMGSNYPSASSLPPNGGKDVLTGVADYLADADLTFGNVEGVLLDKGGTSKTCGANCYSFRSPQAYASIWKSVGFDLMSVANNHASDFGDAGRAATAEALQKAGLEYGGSIEKPTAIFEHKGIKYGFLAVAPNRGCFELKNYEEAAKIVAEMDKKVDIVIVSFHGGAEGVAYRHVPCKDEIFLGANRGNVCKFAKMCIDAGADILFGHGPHVTRGIELYKDRFIIYSMGNFCTYEKFSIDGSKGLAPIMKLKVDKTGKFLAGQIIPTQQIGKGIPKYDEKGLVIKEISDLSRADFPQSPLVVQPDGIVLKK